MFFFFGLTYLSLIQLLFLSICLPSALATSNKANYSSSGSDNNILDTIKDTIVWFDPFVSVEDIIYLQQYDEQHHLTQLIEKVASRFQRVMIPIREESKFTIKRNYSSLQLLPSAIAKYNLKIKNSSKTLPLEIWLVQVLSNFPDSAEKNLEKLQEIGDKANAIFPGTVPVILEYYSFLNSSTLTPHISRISRIRRQNFKYGLVFPIQSCTAAAEKDNLLGSIGALRNNLDILFFTHVPSPSEVIEGNLPSFVPRLIENFTECQKNVWTVAPKDVLVGFITQWPDTNDNGVINYTNLVNFWGKMSSWAAHEASKTPLVLRSVFDNVYESELNQKTLGWWQVKENEDFDLNFLEKIDLISESEELQKLSRNLTWLRKKTEFSREHVIVRFDPFISNGKKGVWSSTSNDESDLSHLFLQSLTQASKIILHELNLFDGDRRLQLIPGAVAKIKRFNREAEVEMAEVILTVTEMKNWNITKEVADKANFMNPGTVKTLLIHVREEVIFEDRLEQLKMFFKFARQHSKIPSSRTDNYKIAGMFLSEKCFIPETSKEFTNELVPLLQYLDEIFFMELIYSDVMMLGVDRVVPQLSTRFLNCKRKIQKVSPAIKVGLLTGWSDLDDKGNQNFAQQVKFWEMMNDFAVRMNTSVIFLEAFDQLRKGDGGHLGLFRLVEDDSYKSPSEYKFQDKRELALQQFLGKPSSQTRSLTIIEIIGITVVVVLVIALIVLSMLLLRRRKEPNVKILLTKEEVNAFFDGVDDDNAPLLVPGGSENESSIASNQNYNKPYDRDKYELTKTSFIIDEKFILGCGEFGKVCKGKVRLEKFHDDEEDDYVDDDDELVFEEVDVAVKMINSKCSDPKTALKGLLSEIKILTYLGLQDNIVGLVGAYTTSITKDNSIYLFLELCSLGSLEKYLRKHDISKSKNKKFNGRVTYTNTTATAASTEISLNTSGYLQPSPVMARGVELSMYENVNEGEASTMSMSMYMAMEGDFEDISKDLYRWSEEIANGMRFLGEKNVVHADLATRNVLLTSEKRAKISDFGLSRRLYDYTNYVKAKQEPLPWRWMAPESLRKLEFNEKTDVWSFGVTLWEIFTYGEIPYPGLNWDVDFCNNLENGLKMSKPLRSSDKVYKIMVKCWTIDADERPTFAEIQSMLK